MQAIGTPARLELAADKVTRMRAARPAPALKISLLFAAILAASMTAPAAAAMLSAHRAVYDLKLARAAAHVGVFDMSGRLVYEFLGDACDGYIVNMRWANRVVDLEGKTEVTDLRSSTWEAGNGEAFRFTTTEYVDSKLRETIRGQARRADDGTVAVELDPPAAKTLEFDGEVAFPTQHMDAVIAAALAGERILQMRVYDGSEAGDKIYETTAVIGSAGQSREPGGVAQGMEELAGLSIWPVSIAFFDDASRGEAVPAYQFSFDLYENGVSDVLTLDYGGFALTGQMREIEFLPEPECP